MNAVPTQVAAAVVEIDNRMHASAIRISKCPIKYPIIGLIQWKLNWLTAVVK